VYLTDAALLASMKPRRIAADNRMEAQIRARYSLLQ